MDAKLTISDIEYIYNLAEHKTDEELAIIVKKPVALIQMLFSLMAGLPKRPWEKVVLPYVPALPPVAIEEPVREKKQRHKLKPLTVGKKRRKVPSKKKAVVKKKATGKKEKPVQVKAENKQHSASAQAMERQRARQIKDRNSIYETKPLDLTGKVRVKLNSKTEVWVVPGTDIEKLKKKYNIA